MKAIRERLGIDKDSEQGLTLIEVIVALMVFGIVAVGVAWSLANILTISRDARNRVAAANIAAEVIDKARSIENVFTVVDEPDTVRTVGGVKYHVKVETGWVNSTDATAQCGASASTGNKALEYKRVNVEVTWDGMKAATLPIRSDTLLAPNSRINDPTLGTIVVSVKDAFGKGASGVNVNTQPAPTPNGAVAVTTQGLATDTDGCSYVLKVVPGNYVVTLSKTNYVDLTQDTNTEITVTVAAGGSVLAEASYDNGAVVTSRYFAGALVPGNLQTTYAATRGTTLLAGSNPVRIFPDSYQLIAGNFDATNCKATDPAAWAVRADTAFGERMDPVTVAAGTPTTIDVPMGLVRVTTGGLSGKWVTAEIQSSLLNGNPGCTAPVGANGAALTKYTIFVPSSPSTNTAVLALPYGTYKLYFGGSSGTTTNALTGVPLDAAGVALPVAAAQIVTLDPRVVH